MESHWRESEVPWTDFKSVSLPEQLYCCPLLTPCPMAHPELLLRVVNIHQTAIKRQQASWNTFTEEKKIGEAKSLPTYVLILKS